MTAATVSQTDVRDTVADLQAVVDQKCLTEALAYLLSTAIPSRSQLPVLTGVLIEATSEGVIVSGFDYEVSATQTIAYGQGVGKALVAARLLQDLIKSMAKGHDVVLYVKGDKLVVTGDGVTYTLPLLRLDEFPELPAVPSVTVGTLNQQHLAGIVDTAVAAGRDCTLPVLTGIRFEPAITKEGKREVATLVTAATDRYRLAVFDTGLKVSAELDPFLVPATNIAKVRKVFKGDVVLSITPGKGGDKIVSFSDDTRTLTLRNLDGEFPRYRSLLPDTINTSVTVEAKALTKGVQQVALVARRTSPVRLVVSDGIKLEAGGLDDAEAEKHVDAAVEGEPFTIAFNPGYLLDGIAAVGTDSVRVCLVAPTKPAVFTSEDRPEFRYLLMPVRLAV